VKTYGKAAILGPNVVATDPGPSTLCPADKLVDYMAAPVSSRCLACKVGWLRR